MSADAASRLFIYIGITTFIGRLLSGFLCNMRRVNPIYVYMLGLVLDGSSVVYLTQAKNYGHLIAFSFFYGLADGLVIGTFNITILYCVEPRKRASAFGLSAIFYGITVATGPPLAGTVKVKPHSVKLANTAGAYPGFRSMKLTKSIATPPGWGVSPS